MLDPHTLGSENHEYVHLCDFLENYFLKEVKGLKMSDLLNTRAYKRSPREVLSEKLNLKYNWGSLSSAD